MIQRIWGFMLKSILTFIYLLIIWGLAAVLFEVPKEFYSSYNVFDTEDVPAVVTEKLSVNNMLGKPQYYVTVDLNEGLHDYKMKNHVTAWNFHRLEVGDPVKGHYIRGEHFYTTLDIAGDSIIVLIGTLFLLAIFSAVVAYPIIHFLRDEQLKDKWLPFSERREKRRKQKIKKQRQQEKRMKPKRLKVRSPKKELKSVSPFAKRMLPKRIVALIEKDEFPSVFLIICMITTLIFISGPLLNGVTKLSPIGKTKTTALVTDIEMNKHIQYKGAREYYYTMDLFFLDHRGQDYQVTKEVTSHVYDKFERGDRVEISYVTLNPYNIFVRDYSFRNFTYIIFKVKFIFLSIGFIFLLIFVNHYLSLWKKNGKRKKGEMRKK